MRLFILIVCIAGFLSNTTQAQLIDSSTLLQDIKTLSSDAFEGRRPGSRGHELANAYIEERFKKAGLKKYNNTYQHSFTINDSIQGRNIIGYIAGKTNNCIVISAHYDHLGIRKDKIYNGADDNASGAAALMAFAEYFGQQKEQPYYTLIFAAFDAEETGLRGAKAFVNTPPVALSSILLNINMDMISRNDKNELYACGTYHYPQLKKYITSQNNFIVLKTGHDIPGTGINDWTNQSDQGAFHQKKIPFIYFGVEDHPDYHTANDKFENIQPRFYYNASLTILEIVKSVVASAM